MPELKKLIEVALPLEAINREASREKSIRHGHPSTLHLWWARRPLAACRAVIFASLVDDPSSHPENFPTEEAQDNERQRLFRVIEQLVKWESVNDERVLQAAREEILKSTGGNPPCVLDPFCGGGSIPLEAQRLGLEARASDLNPVAVLITKTLVELPPKFAGHPPVNPEARKRLDHTRGWKLAQGLADDVRYYGIWMQREAEKKIGHHYPKAKLPKGSGATEAPVIAWLWIRTVKCPNPACNGFMPLARSFWLSKKRDKKWWVEPVVQRDRLTVTFEVKSGNGEPPPGTKQRGKTACILCGNQNITDAVLRSQASGHGIRVQLMAIVADGPNGRVFLSPDEHTTPAVEVPPTEWLEHSIPAISRWFSPPAYGLTKYSQLFSPRQLSALTTFSELIPLAKHEIVLNARHAGLGENAADEYAKAVATYLAFAVNRCTNYWSSFAPWGGDFIVQTFGRQALPMVWDFAEANPFSESTGNWLGAIEWISKCLEVAVHPTCSGMVKQLDATAALNGSGEPVVITDPPYYDNIGYSELSDYFYLWLRHTVGKFYPDLFSTVLTPKSQELVAAAYRFEGDKSKAKDFFEQGLGKAFSRMREVQNRKFPLTLYYAFKQAEDVDDESDSDSGSGIASTGWETMLEGLLKAGFRITGTWPMRTERDQGLKTGTNVLASSIVLVCHPRSSEQRIATRREFIASLKRELPDALRKLQRGSIAPVDFAQAAIGPGMAIFSAFAKVVEADGTSMPVRSALGLINQALDEVLSAQEGEFDSDTRWALAWFEQHGFQDGPFGDAETLSKAKDTSISSMVQAGILAAKSGKVRLLKRGELPEEWDPVSDKRLTVWEVAQYAIRELDKEGERGAAILMKKVGSLGEIARDLSYRLYNICERKKWAQEALAYNSLVIAWPEITRLAASEVAVETAAQGRLI